MVFASAKALGILASRRNYPFFDYYDRLKGLFTDTSKHLRVRQQFFENTVQKVTERLERVTDRRDFMAHILDNQSSPEKALTKDEIVSNSVLFLVAGSETTATMLSGTTYLLLKDPKIYKKLVEEVRGAFEKADDITVDAVSKLPYLLACLQEGLRYYPPVPTGFPRVVPPGGDTISGHYIPEGVSKHFYCKSHPRQNTRGTS
jgi:cytochrome P450